MTDLGTLDHRMQQVLRNTALHLVTRIAPVRSLVADQMEETDLAYRRSPIVTGQARRSGVRPGDSAPDVPGTALRELLIASGAGTTAMVFGNASAGGAAPLVGLPQIRIVLYRRRGCGRRTC